MITNFLFFSLAIILFLGIKLISSKPKMNQFEQNQLDLETAIYLEQEKLHDQKNKTAIADDFKKSIKDSNQELMSKIAQMNESLFEEIHKSRSI